MPLLIPDSLYHFAFFLTGEKQQALALFSDTYLNAIGCHRSIKLKNDPEIFLFRTMHDIFISQYYQGEIDASVTDSEGEEKYEYEPPPKRETIQKFILLALNEIPVQLKEVIILKDVLGFNYKKIGSILGTSDKVVRSLLCMGRNSLKKILNQYTQDHPGKLSGGKNKNPAQVWSKGKFNKIQSNIKKGAMG